MASYIRLLFILYSSSIAIKSTNLSLAVIGVLEKQVVMGVSTGAVTGANLSGNFPYQKVKISYQNGLF